MTKICQRCGREITPRKKWNDSFEQIKYCSEKCRRTKPKPHLEETILNLLRQRARGATICPSEVLPPEHKQDKLKMEEVRQAGRLLVAKNLIEITQKNKVVDPSEFKGPIRFRLKT